MILNGKVSNPGELRTSIILKSRTASGDAGGFQTPTWTTVATVLAKWSNAHGSEVWTADMAGAKQAATVMIRYRSGLDTTCAVEKGGVLYEIVSIDDIQERHEYMELKVQRMGSG
jgi:SPP1 family predicted phage head-tail adaptor